MRAYVVFFILSCLTSAKVLACQCASHECDLVFSTLMVAEVISITQAGYVVPEDRSSLLSKDQQKNLSQQEVSDILYSDRIALVRVLKADDKRLKGKIFKVRVDRTSSCSTNMGYGFHYFEFGRFWEFSDTMSFTLSRCVPHVASKKRPEVEGYFQLKLDLRKKCIENGRSGQRAQVLASKTDSTKNIEFLHFSLAFQNGRSYKNNRSHQKEEQIYIDQVQELYDSSGLKAKSQFDRLYVTLYILEDGSVYKSEINVPATDVDYSEFLKRVDELRFPIQKFKKGSQSPRSYAYLLSVPIATR